MFDSLLHKPGIVRLVNWPCVCSYSLTLYPEPSKSSLRQFSKDDDFLYLLAGDEAKVKVFALPVPPTPSKSTTHPELDSKYSIPVALTQGKTASGLQTLPGSRILFSQSSFTSPNDVYVASDLKTLEGAILVNNDAVLTGVRVEKVTNFSDAELKGKSLSEGEEFWFKGAEGKNVQGWVIKPRSWTEGEKKKWPGLLFIHGGLISISPLFSALGSHNLSFRPSRRLGGCVVNTMEPKWWVKSVDSFFSDFFCSGNSFRSTRLFCRLDKPNGKHDFWTRYSVFLSSYYHSVAE